jgi:hypothetical protein
VRHHGNAPDFVIRLISLGRRVISAMFEESGRFDPPGEPDAPVREPRRRSPGGGGSAVALAEPVPPQDVLAVRRSPTQQKRGDPRHASHNPLRG